MNKMNVSPLPEPTVLVTVNVENKNPNIITIAWTGVFSHSPSTVYTARYYTYRNFGRGLSMEYLNRSAPLNEQEIEKCTLSLASSLQWR